MPLITLDHGLTVEADAVTELRLNHRLNCVQVAVSHGTARTCHALPVPAGTTGVAYLFTLESRIRPARTIAGPSIIIEEVQTR
jgi:hypothetical protein